MSDNQEIKKLLVVGLAILVLLGVFIGFRACTKSDKEKVDEVEETKKPTPDVTPTDNDKTVIEETATDASKEQPVKVVQTVSKKEAPVVTLKQKYSVDLNGEIKLPEITEDDNGNKVTTEITIEFLPFGSVKYESVNKIDTSKLGTYKVTYKFTNEDGVSSKTVITIEIVDSEAPVISAKAYKDVPVDPLDPNAGTETIDEDLENGDYTNWASVKLFFDDNDKIAEVKYYKVTRKMENGEVVEQDPVEIQDVDSNSFTEDGEYLVKAYDRSNNVSEFRFVIDIEPPDVTDFLVKYNQVDNDMTVRIVSAPAPDQATNEERVPEKIQGVNVQDPTSGSPVAGEDDGWVMDEEDEISISKVYDKDATEGQDEVTVIDKAGNESDDPVVIDTHKIIKVTKQDGSLVIDGEISASDNAVVTVTEKGTNVVVTINGVTVANISTDISLNDSAYTVDEDGNYVIEYVDDEGNSAIFTVKLVV